MNLAVLLLTFKKKKKTRGKDGHMMACRKATVTRWLSAYHDLGLLNSELLKCSPWSVQARHKLKEEITGAETSCVAVVVRVRDLGEQPRFSNNLWCCTIDSQMPGRPHGPAATRERYPRAVFLCRCQFHTVTVSKGTVAI
jgi:hypothetical protein